ncbi:hypothetical protein Tco_0889637 [Tanacetum coccineum]
MTTPSNNSQMHNGIMATGLKECPPILAPGESINKQDVKTKLFLEFSKFTSRNGESIESYYTTFYRMMNEMVRNKLKVDTMLANVRPTNNNLRTTLNTRNKNVDTYLRTEKDRQTGQFRNQRTGFGHFAKECRKPKKVKDYEYHKEKMSLCKQESRGITLSAEPDERLQDTNEELDEQELESHYMYMVHTDDDYNVFANETQHYEQPESINDTYLVEKTDSNVTPDSSNICDNEGMADQNVNEPKNERVVLASLLLI